MLFIWFSKLFPLVTKSTFLASKSPSDATGKLKLNLSSDSSNNKVAPLNKPREIFNPAKPLDTPEPVSPLFISIKLSSTTKSLDFTIVLAPVTVRLFTITLFEKTLSPAIS